VILAPAMSREAAAAGISRAVIDSAFAGLTQDGAVLAFDRRQRGSFRKSFEEYAATRVVPARINRARQLMQRHAFRDADRRPERSQYRSARARMPVLSG
jgi:membrane-bound lytic murein transglycosylase B